MANPSEGKFCKFGANRPQLRLRRQQCDRDKSRRGTSRSGFLGNPRCRFELEHEDLCQHGRALAQNTKE